MPADHAELTAPSGEVVAAARARRAPTRRVGDREVPAGAKALRTRELLLETAQDVFARQGCGATSVADIADAAGVSLGTFYQYFRDRADVLATLVSMRALELLDRTRRWDSTGGRLAVRRVVASFVSRYAATAQLQRVWEEVTHTDPEMAALRRDLTRVFNEGVERELRRAGATGLARSDLDPAEAARALTAMVDRYCYLVFVFDPPSPAVAVDDVIDLLSALWADGIRLAEPQLPHRT